MADIAAIKAERQKVYGDPRENHRGIAMAWAGLLQPHADKIRDGVPIPDWCVAHLMAALKLNRMRRVYKEDNYDDLRAYLDFAQQWQKEEPCQERTTSPDPCAATPNTTSPPSTVQRLSGVDSDTAWFPPLNSTEQSGSPRTIPNLRLTRHSSGQPLSAT